MLQALATSTGAVSLAAAMPIIMGQNIGTTVTALIASAGTNKNARRTAFIHLYFNIVGTVVPVLRGAGAFGLPESLTISKLS